MTSFPMRARIARPYPLTELAGAIDAPHPTREVLVHGIAPLAQADERQIGFLAHRRYLPDLERTRAGALLVSRDVSNQLPGDTPPFLVVDDPHFALITLLDLFHPTEVRSPDIHPTAVIGTGVTLGADVSLGPYAVLEPNVVVEDGVSVGAHVTVGARSRIGRDTIIYPQCVLYPDTVLGDRVILHSGSRVGVDGFGYVYHGNGHRKVPQIGTCVIEDDVEIGANSTIDRGSIGVTRIGAGTKIDNLVHLGHNVTIGPHSILAGQAGISGSAHIGTGVMVGGQAGVGGHLSVGSGARLAGQAGIIGDVPEGATVMGFPARPRTEFLRSAAAQGRVPDLIKRVKKLETILERLGFDSEMS